MEQTQNNEFLGTVKIHKLLLKFSIPCILSLVISALYNIVDQIFIGNSSLGYLGNAATGIVFPITIITLAFAWCFGDGAAAYISLCQGRNDTQNAHKCVGSAITITLLVGIVLMALSLAFREPLLRLFGASDATIGLAMDYFLIVALAFPIYMLMNMMNAVIRADGSPKTSMFSMASGAIINIILDPIFIYALDWGIKGAAYATVIGEIVSFIICIFYFLKTKTFKLTFKSFIPNFKVFGNAVKLGVSTFITQISIVVISLVCNIVLFKYGSQSIYGPDIPIAIISIETKVFTIVINIVVGLILGAQPILGYNYGAKNYARVKETYKLTFIITAAIGLFFTIFFEACPQLIIGIFGKGTDLYNEFGNLTFRIFLSLVTFTCLIKMNSIFFQAVGEPVKAAISSLIRDIVCFIPLVVVLPIFFGVKGILFAAPAADLISMIVASFLAYTFFKKISKNIPTTNPIEDTYIKESKPGVIITIARQHGSAGKKIGQEVAKKLNIPCYYKEVAALAAQESGLDKQFISDINRNSPNHLHDLYLSSNTIQQAITAQDLIIQKIASCGSCVIIGRAADYVLRNNPNVFKIFIKASMPYRIAKLKEMYNDNEIEATQNIEKSDNARKLYYQNISSKEWGNPDNYDLVIDASNGIDEAVNSIIKKISNK